MKHFYYLIIILFSLLLVEACSTQKFAQITLKKINPKYTFTVDSIPTPPDYSNTDDWFLYQIEDSSEIDVFFIHPTTYKSDDNWNQPLEDSVNYAKTVRKSINPQALLFDSISNVFAPRYRQATFYSFFDADSNGVEALDVALNDIRTAFLYFIENANNNKPLIIAAHSQGSYHAMNLLKEKEIQELIGDRLIIAYLIGWPLRESDMKELPYAFCQDSTQLSCITSWNSQKEHATFSIKSYTKEEKVYSNNPLSWTSDSLYYDNSYNKGAYFLVEDSLVFRPNYIGAKNYNGILAVDKPKEKGKLNIRRYTRNYHAYDIAFFYRNILENAGFRKEVYLKSE